MESLRKELELGKHQKSEDAVAWNCRPFTCKYTFTFMYSTKPESYFNRLGDRVLVFVSKEHAAQNDHLCRSVLKWDGSAVDSAQLLEDLPTEAKLRHFLGPCWTRKHGVVCPSGCRNRQCEVPAHNHGFGRGVWHPDW